ncbi:hypothetical protein M9H77_22156 [Catharanthus roseus]|uniref:Uncharacterized protein n=1 Tax=Catharanthus roseus TaxID=4058 RepID=A0ACC0APE1_CATRO|nr:hypothetical protein M9H77_22156 [Catharanthus roseus]
MAPSSSSRKKGKKKVYVELVDVVGEDMISNLPDSILCFILSFLPTLHSVQTSLLSKRWDFLNNPRQHGKRIEKIVNGIFTHHNVPSLDNLYLNMEGKISKLYFVSWISVAIAKNIRHLYLQTSYTESIKVPENLFICKTLECLLLCDLQVMIRGKVYLPRLHTLIYFL